MHTNNYYQQGVNSYLLNGRKHRSHITTETDTSKYVFTNHRFKANSQRLINNKKCERKSKNQQQML